VKPDIEAELSRYVARIEQLQPDPARLRAAITPTGQARRRAGRHRWTPLAVGLACLLVGATVAAAATGWLDSALDSFLHGGKAPGQVLSGNDLPNWLRPSPGFNAPDEVSEVAAAGDERLYAYRQGGNICFDYGHHVGECRSPKEWRRELEKETWIVRGPVGRFVWFGLVDASVVSIKAEYRRGAPVEVPVTNGGFVADLDRARDLERLVGLDAARTEVVALSVAGASR
jgi:hypothetical protein